MFGKKDNQKVTFQVSPKDNKTAKTVVSTTSESPLLCGHCNIGNMVRPNVMQNRNAGDIPLWDPVEYNFFDEPVFNSWEITSFVCVNPSCQKVNIYLEYVMVSEENPMECRVTSGRNEKIRIFPHKGTPPRLEGEEHVPATIIKDWQDAWVAVQIIPRSAALQIRACIERILRDKGYSGYALSALMKAAKSDQAFPEGERSVIFNVLDDFKELGNAAAHDTEPIGESNDLEYVLTFVQAMIDMYYVVPAKSKHLKGIADSRKADRKGGR